MAQNLKKCIQNVKVENIFESKFFANIFENGTKLKNLQRSKRNWLIIIFFLTSKDWQEIPRNAKKKELHSLESFMPYFCQF